MDEAESSITRILTNKLWQGVGKSKFRTADSEALWKIYGNSRKAQNDTYNINRHQRPWQTGRSWVEKVVQQLWEAKWAIWQQTQDFITEQRTLFALLFIFIKEHAQMLSTGVIIIPPTLKVCACPSHSTHLGSMARTIYAERWTLWKKAR